LALVTLCWALTKNASAQPMEGVMQWQISADNGATWVQHAEVGGGQSSVLVRLIATWSGIPAGERSAFADTGFDGIVRGIDCGAGDTVSDFLTSETAPGNLYPTVSWTGMGGPPVGYRQGDILKIDSILDAEPPGQGSRFVLLTQGHPSASDFFDLSNPIRLMQYSLVLDGSSGTREIGGLWAVRTPDGRPRLTLYHDDRITQQWPLTTYKVPSSVTDASVTVVPAPGILGLLGVFALPRRRR
jgi:hypothetical protein